MIFIALIFLAIPISLGMSFLLLKGLEHLCSRWLSLGLRRLRSAADAPRTVG